jgi:hypothetical protein
MPKFKMKMKLTGFELEIESERADVPLMAANLGQQFAQMLEPTANIAEGEPPRKAVSNALPASQVEEKPYNGRGRGRRPNGTGTKGGSVAVQLTHDEAKWGDPLQSWNPTNKAIWLLHVVEAASGTKELSAGDIAATFNTHFKAFGKVLPANVSRDLKKSKSGAGALFVEDTETSPSKWSLSATGKQEASKLIAAAKSGAAAEVA